MNKLKKSLALVAVLAIASTGLVACGGESSTPATTTKASTTAAAGSEAATTAAGSDATTTAAAGSDAAATTAAAAPAGENKVSEDDSSKCTILAWNANDIPPMIKNFEAAKPDMAGKCEYKNVGSNGQEAHEQYSQYFKCGEDCDLFVMEADWILDYIDNDEFTAPITDLGFAESDFGGAYAYTLAIGKNKDGKLKGVSWQATPGAYIYRTDLAEKYLGAKTPEEMQAKVKDWDTFKASAKTVADATGGKLAMVDTLGGMWQVWQYNRANAWVKDGELAIDDFYKSYAELAKEYWDNGYVTKESQWDNGWYAVGQVKADEVESKNATLGYFFCTWCLGKGSMLSNAEGGETGPTYGLYNIVSGPTDWAWGGSWLALAKNANSGKIAHDFVEFFTMNADTMQKYAEYSGDFLNSPKAMKAIVDAGTNKNAYIGGQDQFGIFYEAAANIKMDNITKYDSALKKYFSDNVSKYVQGNFADVDAMIEGFKTDVYGNVAAIQK